MQFTYYVYEKPECNIKINRMPIWFKEIEFNGDISKGMIILHTNDDYDENWGANAKMEIQWEKKDRFNFLHHKEVQNSIDVYSAINMVITEKENTWVRSHEFTYWLGSRSKIIRKQYYSENGIHSIFYCDLTERLFSLHTSIIAEQYINYKPYILEAYKSFICH